MDPGFGSYLLPRHWFSCVSVICETPMPCAFQSFKNLTCFINASNAFLPGRWERGDTSPAQKCLGVRAATRSLCRCWGRRLLQLLLWCCWMFEQLSCAAAATVIAITRKMFGYWSIMLARSSLILWSSSISPSACCFVVANSFASFWAWSF